MHRYLLSLDIKMLEALYIKQTDVLKLRLLGGACWNDTALEEESRSPFRGGKDIGRLGAVTANEASECSMCGQRATGEASE